MLGGKHILEKVLCFLFFVFISRVFIKQSSNSMSQLLLYREVISMSDHRPLLHLRRKQYQFPYMVLPGKFLLCCCYLFQGKYSCKQWADLPMWTHSSQIRQMLHCMKESIERYIQKSVLLLRKYCRHLIVSFMIDHLQHYIPLHYFDTQRPVTLLYST